MGNQTYGAAAGPGAGGRATAGLKTLDGKLIELVRRHSLSLLRLALAVVFVWFGALKVVGASPVTGVVHQVAPALATRPTVVAIGVMEIVIGVGILVGWAIRVTLALFFAQMVSTLAIMALRPDLTFRRGNPLLLTTLGEFVVKNLVLIAAGLAILRTVPKASGDERAVDALKKAPHEDGAAGFDRRDRSAAALDAGGAKEGAMDG